MDEKTRNSLNAFIAKSMNSKISNVTSSGVYFGTTAAI